ncbi:hypothetical protein N431DRAFT_447274 [Stipitochalara longipes BDJ]|nr:hypothetical protein N431DRAFT_447274 [Stipitochalara longipes BDJ]
MPVLRVGRTWLCNLQKRGSQTPNDLDSYFVIYAATRMQDKQRSKSQPRLRFFLAQHQVQRLQRIRRYLRSSSPDSSISRSNSSPLLPHLSARDPSPPSTNTNTNLSNRLSTSTGAPAAPAPCQRLIKGSRVCCLLSAVPFALEAHHRLLGGNGAPQKAMAGRSFKPASYLASAAQAPNRSPRQRPQFTRSSSTGSVASTKSDDSLVATLKGLVLDGREEKEEASAGQFSEEGSR